MILHHLHLVPSSFAFLTFVILSKAKDLWNCS